MAIDARGNVDDLLSEIGRLSRQADELEASAQAEIDRVMAQYQAIGETRARIEDLDKDLKKLLKKDRMELFGDRDKVTLTNGRIYWQQGRRLSLPDKETAIELIKAQGWEEAIITIERVDRPVVEQWPEERLVAIGAGWKPQNKFSYEVKKDG